MRPDFTSACTKRSDQITNVRPQSSHRGNAKTRPAIRPRRFRIPYRLQSPSFRVNFNPSPRLSSFLLSSTLRRRIPDHWYFPPRRAAAGARFFSPLIQCAPNAATGICGLSESPNRTNIDDKIYYCGLHLLRALDSARGKRTAFSVRSGSRSVTSAGANAHRNGEDLAAASERSAGGNRKSESGNPAASAK